jgi:hypothetical protein
MTHTTQNLQKRFRKHKTDTLVQPRKQSLLQKEKDLGKRRPHRGTKGHLLGTKKEHQVEKKRPHPKKRDTTQEISEPRPETRKDHLAETTIKRALIQNMTTQCPSTQARATISPQITIQALAIVNQATNQGVHIRAQEV